MRRRVKEGEWDCKSLIGTRLQRENQRGREKCAKSVDGRSNSESDRSDTRCTHESREEAAQQLRLPGRVHARLHQPAHLHFAQYSCTSATMIPAAMSLLILCVNIFYV